MMRILILVVAHFVVAVGANLPVTKNNRIINFLNHEIPENGKILVHLVYLSKHNALEIICPRAKGEYSYDLLPNRSESIPSGDIYVYATIDGVYQKVNINDVVRFESADNQPKLRQQFGMTRMLLNQGLSSDIVRYDVESFDVHCAPADNADGVHKGLGACLSSASLNEEERSRCKYSKKGSPMLGIVRVSLSSVPRAYTGCGSMSAPFLLDGWGKVSTGTSCVVDVMETPDVGFYCKGRIEPANCPFSLYYGNNDMLSRMPFKVDVSSSGYEGGTMLAMRYDRSSITSPFSGRCRCIDKATNTVTAVIEITSKERHVCDLSAKLTQHLSRPIAGDWCDVVLYPGSSLEILFPVTANELSSEVREALLGGDNVSGPISTFMPAKPDVEALTRTAGENTLVYGTVPLISVVDPKVVEVDSALLSDGVVYIQHKVSEAEPADRDPASFYFRCLHKGGSDHTSVTSTIKVTIAYGSPNESYAGDAAADALNNPARVSQYFTDMADTARIQCNSGEHMVPKNCASLTFNANRTAVIPLPRGMRSYSYRNIDNLRDFKVEESFTNPFSLHCSCINDDGVETWRVTFNQIPQKYTMKGQSPDIKSMIMVPRIKSYDVGGMLRHDKIVIPVSDVYNEQKVLRVSAGTLNGLLCTPPKGMTNFQSVPLPGDVVPFKSPVDSNLQGDHFDNDTVMLRQDEDVSKSYATWFPYNDSNEFVNLVKTGDEYTLTTADLNTVMISKGGFSIGYNVDHESDLIDRSDLTIRYPLGSIVISRYGRTDVTLHYVCGSISPPISLEQDRWDETKRQHAGESPEMEERSMVIWEIAKVHVPTTDPYVQGCGIPSESDGLFRPDTVPLTDDSGKTIGCVVNLKTAKVAGFYCPLPYRTDPPDCQLVLRKGPQARLLKKVFNRLRVYRSTHFHLFERRNVFFVKDHLKREKKLYTYVCNCETITGVVVSTIKVQFN
ncbi:hypothetical protein BBBOND_0400600 [Babesia bigemina]|uniref:Uncharacterized protein n=1 Tax=Babesia bigemina TaxID=5866 RepID=A0A061DAI9_BABBI|nr:hypothetical protein BBBOND_0400600 [Babesia bigemina]CDR97568.1 hypothetical protein BBBOND_0400600 [Babesia bigemina]|eukprot:XP_012769754.1 hypothetical protein BBBOND_0400600 [Babesia bigemina]